MDYLEILKENNSEMVESLRRLISIKSVREEPVKGADGVMLPFGAGVEEAYKYMMQLGAEMGFETADFDHYAGHIEFRSENPDAETFGIVGHLDVVPEGTGWTTDPYGAEIIDGWMYGRGTTDDKGPVLTCLYAMKAIKDAGLKPHKNIRLILGLDEETSSEGMNHYTAAAGMPDSGVTPDAEFPLINGEMGIMIFDLAEKVHKHTTKEGLVLNKLEGGTAPNVVPEYAKATINAPDSAMLTRIKEHAAAYAAETGYGLTAKRSGSTLIVEARGVSCHGAKPWDGLNAISILMEFLGRLEFAGEEINDFIAYYNDNIGFDLHGERLGCDFEDEHSGHLILNVGKLELNQDVASVTVNIRYPVLSTGEDVFKAIEQSVSKTSIGILKRMHEGPIFIDPDDPFVEKLMEAYIEETGDTQNKPKVIGGGTYAKLVDRTFAFGAMFPGDEDRMHMPDERISLESLEKISRIYAKMIYKLCCE
jgi:succinyl-diaminopimelate desuccinylase